MNSQLEFTGCHRVWIREWFHVIPGGGFWWTAAPWLAEQWKQWLDKDIRGTLIKFADDTESLGRADVPNDRINTQHSPLQLEHPAGSRG